MISDDQGIEDAIEKRTKQMVEKIGTQNTGIKQLVEGLKGVVDGMKQSAGEETAEVHKAVGGLKVVAEGMRENFNKLEKVVSTFKTGIALISLRQGVRGTLATWSKRLVEKVSGTQKTGLERLKGVVQQLKLDSAVKQEVVVKAVERVMKAVNGMKEKSSNIGKVKTLLSSRPLRY